MTILIVNIGTSDLAVKIQGSDYYIPIFEREEPNEQKAELTPSELEAWNNRNKYIAENLCLELNLPVTQIENRGSIRYEFSFRELTEKLLAAYRKNRETWHSRLRPCRIGGAILAAKERFAVRQVYIFTTNQQPIHKDDTLHFFEILQEWFSYEKFDLTFVDAPICPTIKANDQDKLLDYYYEFFNQNISNDATILVSIKGGTPQMQTALRIQAISASTSRLMFIDPQLSISRTLAGQFSDCTLNPYWRYMRTQKYQIVQQLLERWDFDGAAEILRKWLETLEFFGQSGILDIVESKKAIVNVIKALDVAICYLNLDISGAETIIQSHPCRDAFNFSIPYDKLLNLYTQCRIYWELNRVADFLSRMASFCEETLHEIIEKLPGLKYFDKINYPDDWYLVKPLVEHQLWQYFAQRERLDSDGRERYRFINHNFREQPKYRLPGRFSKWNFVSALIDFRDKANEKVARKELADCLDRLDYWVDCRNQLIHSAKGVSKDSMSKLLIQEPKSTPQERACEPDQILAKLTNIRIQTYTLLNQPIHPCVGYEPQVRYYIYSDIKDWIIEQLKTDA